jgi:acetyl-CoA synthetase
MGTAEVESALVLHPAVVEAAVVGVSHDIKGEDIYAFVTLRADIEPSEELRAALKVHVRTEIGPIATPGTIHWAPALPKTRSGKIMRRILRIIAKKGKGATSDDFGDTSTLADDSVVGQLVESYGS